jgi:hypothetical protein
MVLAKSQEKNDPASSPIFGVQKLNACVLEKSYQALIYTYCNGEELSFLVSSQRYN